MTELTLTPEQLTSFIQKWKNLLFSTKPINIEQCTKIIHQLYESLELSKPNIVVIQGPTKKNNIPPQIYDEAYRQVYDQVYRQLYDEVYYDHVFNQVCTQVYRRFDQSYDHIYNQSYNHGWRALFCDYYQHDKILPTPLKLFVELHNHCSCVCLTETTAYLIQRPEQIHLNSQEQLHNPTGPAVIYRDQTTLWRLNGVHVPPWLVLKPSERIIPQRILELDNAQARAEFIKKVGIDRCFQAATILDAQDDYVLGKLSNRTCLKMINRSTGEIHIEWIPPRISTVKGALKWRNKTSTKPTILT